jgi:hypothetical protein
MGVSAIEPPVSGSGDTNCSMAWVFGVVHWSFVIAVPNATVMLMHDPDDTEAVNPSRKVSQLLYRLEHACMQER